MGDDVSDEIRYSNLFALTGGSYHYYAPEATTPVLCEIRDAPRGCLVWFMDAERAQPLAKFAGRFVRLVECGVDDAGNPLGAVDNEQA